MLKSFNLIGTELLKLKHKRFLYLLAAPSLALPILTMFYYLYLGGKAQIKSFTDFSEWSAITYTVWIILPVVLGVTGTMMLYDEIKNDTLKQLWIIPISKAGYFSAKFGVLLLLSIIYMMITAAITIILGTVLSFNDISSAAIIFLLKKCLQIGILTPFAMLPILLIAVFRKGFVLPICITFIYTFLGFIMLNFAMQFYPLSCVTAIVVYGMPGAAPTVPINLVSCYINLIISSIICATASIFILKKIDCYGR